MTVKHYQWDELRRELGAFKPVDVKVWSDMDGAFIRVWFVPTKDAHGKEALLIAGEKSMSVVIRRDTPANAFEIVRGNFPLDVSRRLVVLMEGLARPDIAMALDAELSALERAQHDYSTSAHAPTRHKQLPKS